MSGGATPGNSNAMTHGLYSGALPAGCGYIRKYTDKLRVTLERAVLAMASELTVYDAACIMSAVRWERHALLAQKWLRLHSAEMTHDQRLAYSREIARASTERDRSIKALGLDRRDVDVLDIYSTISAEDAGGATPERQEGNGDEQ